MLPVNNSTTAQATANHIGYVSDVGSDGSVSLHSTQSERMRQQQQQRQQQPQQLNNSYPQQQQHAPMAHSNTPATAMMQQNQQQLQQQQVGGTFWGEGRKQNTRGVALMRHTGREVGYAGNTN